MLVVHAGRVERLDPFSVQVLVDLRTSLILDNVAPVNTRISEGTKRRTTLISAVEKHEYAVRREFLDLPWYTEFVKRLQGCLTLIVFYHVSL